jgi:hypothetical protein
MEKKADDKSKPEPQSNPRDLDPKDEPPVTPTDEPQPVPVQDPPANEPKTPYTVM